MAELVDALGSGPSGGNTVEVRVLFWAPCNTLNSPRIPLFLAWLLTSAASRFPLLLILPDQVHSICSPFSPFSVTNSGMAHIENGHIE